MSYPSYDSNEEIQFHSDGTESENGKIIFYLWNFREGRTSTEANPSYGYGEKRTYNVERTVKDSRGKESKEQIKVTVKKTRKQVDCLKKRRYSGLISL
nr:PKD domain-containing protein [Bacillus cereus]